MKYYLIGADGKTYGPVSAEMVRQWQTEGRANARTAVFIEGSTNWTYLGLLPDFYPPNPASPPPSIGALPPQARGRGTNGLAVAGFVCGLLSWVGFCCCCGMPLNLLGLVFSIVALTQINAQAEPQEGRVFAILGIILSAVSLLGGFSAILLNLALHPGNASWNFNF